MSVPFTAPDGGVLVWVNEEWDGRNFRNVGKNDAASSASPIPSSQLLKPRRGPCWRTPPCPPSIPSHPPPLVQMQSIYCSADGGEAEL